MDSLSCKSRKVAEKKKGTAATCYVVHFRSGEMGRASLIRPTHMLDVAQTKKSTALKKIKKKRENGVLRFIRLFDGHDQCFILHVTAQRRKWQGHVDGKPVKKKFQYALNYKLELAGCL